ncbi:MAG: hypothetical protein Q9217_003437 [Psora testacea]
MAIIESHPVRLTNKTDSSDSDIAINAYLSLSTESSSSLTKDPSPQRITGTILPTLASNPTDPTKVIRLLQKSECRQAGDCLAQAFRHDELAKYFTHTEDRKHCSEAENWDLHVFIMQCIVKAHVSRGMVTVIGNNYDCVALWMPPGKNMDDWITVIRSGMYKFRYKLSKEGRKRFFHEFLPLLHNTKLDVMKEHDQNSWYLVYIGTKPGSRGKGYASALIEYTTRQADAENRLCYLESTNTANAKLYQRLGFQSQKRISLTRAPLPVHMEIMTRQPTFDQQAERSSSSAGESDGRRKRWWRG